MPTPRELIAQYATQSQMSSFFVDKVGWKSVKKYSVTGNGSTDDYANLQTAFNDASANDVYIMPPGTYMISAPVVLDTNNITIFAYGATLKASALFLSLLAGISDVVKIKIYGLRFEGFATGEGATSQVGVLIGSNSTGTALANHTVTDGVKWELIDCSFGGPSTTTGLNIGVRIQKNGAGCIIQNPKFDTILGTNSNYGYGVLSNGNHTKVLNPEFRFPTGQGRHAVYFSDETNYCVVDNFDSTGCKNALITIANISGNGKGHQFNNIVIRDCSTTLTDVGVIDLRGAGVGCSINNVKIKNATGNFRGINIMYDANIGVGFVPTETTINNLYIEDVAREAIYTEQAHNTKVNNFNVLNASKGSVGTYATIKVVKSNNCQFDQYTINGNSEARNGFLVDNTATISDNTVIGEGVITGVTGDGIDDLGTNTVIKGSRKVTYTAADTTPSVKGARFMYIANAGAVSITNFDDGIEGQEITLVFADANTTITRNNAYLSGGVNFTSAANATLTLVKRAATWYEVNRVTNNS